MTDTATPIADQIRAAGSHLRLWDPTTAEFVWSDSTEPPEERRPLLDVLAERDGWTLATLDSPNRGRVWAGRMRIGAEGDIEARPEREFMTAITWPDNPAFAPEGGSTDER